MLVRLILISATAQASSKWPPRRGRRRARPHQLAPAARRGRQPRGDAARRRARRAQPAGHAYPRRGAASAVADVRATPPSRLEDVVRAQRRRAGPRDRGRRRPGGRPHVRVPVFRLFTGAAPTFGRRAADGRDRPPRRGRRRAGRELRPAPRRRATATRSRERTTQARLVVGALADARATAATSSTRTRSQRHGSMWRPAPST